MNEPFLMEKDVVSIVKYSVLSLVFGMALGAFGMVYFEKPKPQPVVVHSEMSYATPALDAALDKLKTSLEVHFIQQEALLRKMQQDTVKLSTINKARAAQLIEREPVHVAHGGAGQIATEVTPHSDAAPLSLQQMAADLGVSRMAVK